MMRHILGSLARATLLACGSLALATLVACGSTPPTLLPSSAPRASSPVRIQLSTRLQADAVWSTHARSLLEETVDILHSDRFRELATAQGDLRVSPSEPAVEGDVLVQALVGGLEARRPAKTTLAVADNSVNESVPGVTALCDKQTKALVRIQPYVLQQWSTYSTENRACAVNTLAHELTHTVLDSTGQATRQLFLDGGAWYARLLGRDLVSYGVGTLVECLYLERVRELPEWATQQCIAGRSMRSFAGCEHPAPIAQLEQLGEPACQ